jgi:hypothetical protein
VIFFLLSISPNDIQEALKEKFFQDDLLNHSFFKACLKSVDRELDFYAERHLSKANARV